jgi:phage tail-like protein
MHLITKKFECAEEGRITNTQNPWAGGGEQMNKKLILSILALFLFVIMLSGNVQGPTSHHELKESMPIFAFKLEIEGMETAYFSEVSGLGMEVEYVEYRDSSGDNVVRKIPGRLKYVDITLKRGFVESTEYFDWINSIARGEVERKDGSITVINQRQEEVVTYNFYEGWPIRYYGPTTKETGKGQGEIAMEELTLAHEGLEMVVR